MFIDLLLDLDDDLILALDRCAAMEGSSVEEVIRRRITTTIGKPYAALTEEQNTVTRPMIALDLRQ